MPLDAWEENSALEIGTLCLRLPHPAGRLSAYREQKHAPEPFPHPLANQCPMTEGLQMPFDSDDDRPEQRVQSHDKMIVVIFGIEDSHPACAHGSGRSEPFPLFGKYRVGREERLTH
jgi:hypothetical protein